MNEAALIYNKTNGGQIKSIDFDMNNNVEPDNGVDTGGFEITDDSVKFSVYTYILPKSKIKSYSLFNLKDKVLANILKHDRTDRGSEDSSVRWKSDAKERYLSFAADKMSSIIEVLANNKKVEPKYIISPQSSSEFNKNFINILKSRINDKYELTFIEDYVIKQTTGITINYELAKELGCDADDITSLESWVSESENATEVYRKRLQIEKEIKRIKTRIKKNGIEQDWQFQDTKAYKEKKKHDDKSYAKTDTDAYLSNGTDNKWKGVKYHEGDKLKKVSLSNGEEYGVSNEFYEITKIINKVSKEISDIYKKNEEEKKAAEKRGEEYKASGRFADLSKYIRTSNYPETISGFGSQGNLGGSVNKTNARLNNSIDDNGDVVEQSWQIKGLPDLARKLLGEMFGINDSLRELGLDTSKGILIFDDNIAGGSTLDAICMAIRKVGFDDNNILPISFGIMNDSQAMNMPQGEKQAFRDSYRKDNGIYADDNIRAQKQAEYYDSSKSDKLIDKNVFHNTDVRTPDGYVNYKGKIYKVPNDTNSKSYYVNVINTLKRQGLSNSDAAYIYYTYLRPDEMYKQRKLDHDKKIKYKGQEYRIPKISSGNEYNQKYAWSSKFIKINGLDNNEENRILGREIFQKLLKLPDKTRAQHIITVNETKLIKYLSMQILKEMTFNK